VRGIVAWQTERELSLALTKGDQNEWLAKLLRQSAEKVERDSDRPLGPRENTTRSPPSLRMNACPRGSFRRQFARRQTDWKARSAPRLKLLVFGRQRKLENGAARLVRADP
jgi:hypothetical protein